MISKSKIKFNQFQINAMIYCSKRIEFDAGHRVRDHDGKCKMLHGHRYALEVTFSSQKLNEIGMTIDFGIIKSIIKSWIDENWDHNVILSEKDIELGKKIAEYTGQKIFYIKENPTAENLANFLMKSVIPDLFSISSLEKWKITNAPFFNKLRLYETPSSFVDVVCEK